MPSVFDYLPPQEQEGARFFTHSNIGDSIEGTFVSRTDNLLNNTYGYTYTLVVFKNAKITKVDSGGNPIPLTEKEPVQGGYAKISISSSKIIALKELDACKLGDIIGFLYTGKGKPRAAGFQQSKIIRVAHKEGLVDEEWLDEQQVKKTVSGQPEIPVAAPAVTLSSAGFSQPVSDSLADKLGVPFVTDQDKINHISTLIKAKYGEMASEQIKDKVLESTGLALMIQNLDLIIERLK